MVRSEKQRFTFVFGMGYADDYLIPREALAALLWEGSTGVVGDM